MHWLQASPLLSTFRAINLESGRQGAQFVPLNCGTKSQRSLSHTAFACLRACLSVCLFVCLSVCVRFSVNCVNLIFSLIRLFVNQSADLRLHGSIQAETHTYTRTHTKKNALHDLCAIHLHLYLDGVQSACQCLKPVELPH